MRHLVLLGDSVFDNRAYTRGTPDVAGHLRSLVASSMAISLAAVDGATTYDVGQQLDRVPERATDLVLSLGGNDALMNADLLNLPVRSTAEALDLFTERVAVFRESYIHVIEALTALKRNAIVCTIYHGSLPPPDAQRAVTALPLFNDVILTTALRFGLPVIDLRAVCNEPSDFVNAIEPSGSGGLKIARAVLRSLEETQRRPGRTVVTTS